MINEEEGFSSIESFPDEPLRLPQKTDKSLYLKSSESFVKIVNSKRTGGADDAKRQTDKKVSPGRKSRLRKLKSQTNDEHMTKDKGFYLGAIDAFLPSVSGNGQVVNNSGGAVGLVGTVSSSLTDGAVDNSIVNVNTNSASNTGGVSDSANNMVSPASGNTYLNSDDRSAATNNGTSASNNNNGNNNANNNNKSNNNDDYEPMRIKHNRVRQVRILYCFFVILIALLALFGLLYLRMWSHTNYEYEKTKTTTLTTAAVPVATTPNPAV